MTQQNPFREIYALIWKANEPDETFNQEEFESRIPRLMEWLRELYSNGKLVGCGGGGFENHAGGLTLINAANVDEARELSKGSPMNEIGKTEIFVWDVYYASISELKQEDKLKQS
jgi:uncharacterized protein YciI